VVNCNNNARTFSSPLLVSTEPGSPSGSNAFKLRSMRYRKTVFLFCLSLLSACGGSSDPEPQNQETPEIQEALQQTQTPSVRPSSTPTGTLSAIRLTEIAFANLPRPSDTPAPMTETPSPTASATFTPEPPLPGIAAPNKIIFSSDRAGSDDLWLMDLDGSNPRPIAVMENSNETIAACSPDGLRFVYDSNRSGDRELYLGSYAGGDPRPLTDTDGENFAPSWSPLGDLIVFVSTRDGQSDLWVMDGGGGNLLRLTDDPAEDIAPQWSPDANRIYFASNRAGNYDLYAFEIPTTQTLRITETEDIAETSPALGYDLESVIYTAPVEPARNAVWMADSPLITAWGNAEQPAWLGWHALLFSADLGGVRHIFWMDTLTGNQAILTNLGLRNTWPRPCYMASGGEAARLPVGELPTPTSTPTPQRDSEYAAVINPGADWLEEVVEWAPEELLDLAPEGYELRLEEGLLVYSWQQDGQIHNLRVALEALGGALKTTLVGYNIDDIPQPSEAVQDFAFTLEQTLLSGSIEPGQYRLERVEVTGSTVLLTFLIPPE
jgi:Tol biopolymer transport system component